MSIHVKCDHCREHLDGGEVVWFLTPADYPGSYEAPRRTEWTSHLHWGCITAWVAAENRRREEVPF